MRPLAGSVLKAPFAGSTRLWDDVRHVCEQHGVARAGIRDTLIGLYPWMVAISIVAFEGIYWPMLLHQPRTMFVNREHDAQRQLQQLQQYVARTGGAASDRWKSHGFGDVMLYTIPGDDDIAAGDTVTLVLADGTQHNVPSFVLALNKSHASVEILAYECDPDAAQPLPPTLHFQTYRVACSYYGVHFEMGRTTAGRHMRKVQVGGAKDVDGFFLCMKDDKEVYLARMN